MKALRVVLRLVAILCVTVLTANLVLVLSNTGVVWSIFTVLLGSVFSVVAVTDYINDKHTI